LAAFPFVSSGKSSAISLPKHFAKGSQEFCLDANYEETDSEKVARDIDLPLVRQTTLNNWRAKLISLILATMLWYLIKKNLETTTSSEPVRRPTATETR
jgi:hypothetical protein